jgi:N-acetylglucosaminyldiphosphoundecaprenol N-acetyl-beta-D-mannosaminyltransferase
MEEATFLVREALSIRRCAVLGMPVDELDYDAVLEQVRRWTTLQASRYMCISNVHMVMESYDDEALRATINGADLVAADGVPVIWTSRWLGLRKQSRVFGPELTIRLCDMAAREGIPVGFYGSTPEVAYDLRRRAMERFSTLQISFCYSPPFRALTDAEDASICDAINRSGVRILFVGLGCPKQERWMGEHRSRITATMIGVGWAFEILAGRSKAAPTWIQKIGMEWFYRLAHNPRKLWRRHLKHNPRFVVLILGRLLAGKHGAGMHQHLVH